MIKLSRRGFLMTSGATLVAVSIFSFSSGLYDHIVRIVKNSFGNRVGSYLEVGRFAADIIEELQTNRPNYFSKVNLFFRSLPIGFKIVIPEQKRFSDWIITQFCHSTNVLLAIKRKEVNFVYYGLFDPFQNPCFNPLGAMSS